MSVAAKPLISAQFVPAVETTMYTASGVRAIIDKFVGYNSSASAAVLTVRLVIVGGTAGVSSTLIVKSLAAGETYTFPEIVGNVLDIGGFVSVLAGTASAVVVRASGREVS